MASSARTICAALAAVSMLACTDGGPCKTQGAMRIDGVCDCPEGTLFFEDRVTRTSSCLVPDSGAVAAVDSGALVADAGKLTAPAAPDASNAAGLDAAKSDTTLDAQTSDAETVGDAAPVATASPGNVVPDDGCTVEGQLRCALSGSSARQRCEAGRWTMAESCAAGEVCDAAGAAASATCRAALEVCKGNADKPACDGAIMQFCGKAGFAERATPCASKQQCEMGLAHGICAPCLPGAYRCTGALLERCGADGQKFEAVLPACSSAALCNAQAGACTASACVAGSKTCKGDTLQTCNAELTGFTDTACGAGLCDGVGKECDVCVPNTKTCEGSLVKTCNAQGQDYTTTACPSGRPLCTGSGSCVQCTSPSDCPAARECSVAMCNTASGSCASTFKPSGTPCSAGICDGKGECGPAPTCGDGVRNQASEECDDGNRADIDDCTNACKESFCGDGIVAANGSARPEGCEVGKGGATKWTCSGQCQRQTIYSACSMDGQCTAPELCRSGLCTLPCTPLGGWGTGSDCPLPPSPRVAWCNVGVGICHLSECKTNADCPSPIACASSTSDFVGVSFTTMCSTESTR